MGIRIPALLEAILEATAAKTDAEARIAGLRKVLDEEARRRYTEEGAAPSWKRRNLGAVRLDEPGAWAATVADPAAFGSYVAQHHPTEANGIIEVPADRLEEALSAIGFAGVDVVDTRVEVRPTFRTKYLEGLIVDVEEELDEDGSVDRVITVVDPATGAIVDGTSAQRSPAKLVVTLDRDLRAATIEQATKAAEAVLATVLDEDPVATLRAEHGLEEAPHGNPSTMSLEEALTIKAGREVDLGEALAKHAMRGGGFTTPAIELDRARADLGREPTLEDLERAGIVRPASSLAGIPASELDDRDRHTAQLARLEAEAAERAGHREPYVGEGADGARRSAAIDRTEAEGYDAGEDRDRCLESAARWDAQAAELEATEAGRYAGSVGEASDKALLEESPEQEAATLNHVTPYAAKRADEEAGIDAVEAMDNREALRRVARSKGIPAGGTKRELAERLYAAGVRA